MPEVARANRDYLRGLYSTVKSSDADIKLTLLTGVSKFSKVGLFSGLNNLIDLTLDPRYSAICGYTDGDLDTVFAPELPGLDREAIRDWYNGYNWRGEESLYNPFDILLLFRNREFDAWWFGTGTPAFLVDTLLQRRGGEWLMRRSVRKNNARESSARTWSISGVPICVDCGYLCLGSEINWIRPRSAAPPPDVEEVLRAICECQPACVRRRAVSARLADWSLNSGTRSGNEHDNHRRRRPRRRGRGVRRDGVLRIRLRAARLHQARDGGRRPVHPGGVSRLLRGDGRGEHRGGGAARVREAPRAERMRW